MAWESEKLFGVGGYKSNTLMTQDSGNISDPRKIHTGVYVLLISDPKVIDSRSGFGFYRI